MIIHFSNKGRYNEFRAKQIGSWDIIAKNKTLCWTSTFNKNIVITNDKTKVTCKKCLKQLEKEITP